jgi:xanthine dehydrogenase YagR molybdenum-binding subunit
VVEYRWPETKRVIGTRIDRLDGPVKVTGAAEYTFDVRRPGMLYGAVLRCPHAHARITRLDLEPARRLPGVKAVRAVHQEGDEIQWALDEVVFLAAETEEGARDAVAAIGAFGVEYEVLPHFVDAEAKDRAPEARPGEETTEGDPDAGFARAARRVQGYYGIPTIAHQCLEAHGNVCEWDGDQLTTWSSTQAVSALPGQFAEALGIPATRIRTVCQYMGGGFGSKFSPDRWGIEAARLAKDAGRPVKLMLERDAELTVAGDRPSTYAEVEVGVAEDGEVTAWRSHSWGSGGLGGSGSPPIPYVFQFPHRHHAHTSVPTNVAGSRAWRAPNHPQACFITMAALDDAAAALGLDPLDFFERNLAHTTPRLEPIYREELRIADERMGWRRRWHRRGEGDGTVRRGLGLSIHTWGGRGHRSTCELRVHPDGGVEAKLGSQDLGTGTRTVIAIVLAETFGLGVHDVTVKIGDSAYPPSGGSGGSTTVGGVSASTRRAAQDALAELLAKVAPHLEADPAELEALDGRIRVAGDPSRSLSWKEATAKLGVTPITVTGQNPGEGELNDSGVGGVQMAEVAVDVETGIVRVERMLAVQDCGLVMDLETAESQVHGGMIMGISYALYEEKVMDPVTGRLLATDFESYKIAGYGDVGELEVHMMQGGSHDPRGPIGLGEPPVISPGAAISNAVANAIGVRVPYLPMTPRRVLDALEEATTEVTVMGLEGGAP